MDGRGEEGVNIVKTKCGHANMFVRLIFLTTLDQLDDPLPSFTPYCCWWSTWVVNRVPVQPQIHSIGVYD